MCFILASQKIELLNDKQCFTILHTSFLEHSLEWHFLGLFSTSINTTFKRAVTCIWELGNFRIKEVTKFTNVGQCPLSFQFSKKKLKEAETGRTVSTFRSKEKQIVSLGVRSDLILHPVPALQSDSSTLDPAVMSSGLSRGSGASSRHRGLWSGGSTCPASGSSRDPWQSRCHDVVTMCHARFAAPHR